MPNDFFYMSKKIYPGCFFGKMRKAGNSLGPRARHVGWEAGRTGPAQLHRPPPWAARSAGLEKASTKGREAAPGLPRAAVWLSQADVTQVPEVPEASHNPWGAPELHPTEQPLVPRLQEECTCPWPAILSMWLKTWGAHGRGPHYRLLLCISGPSSASSSPCLSSTENLLLEPGHPTASCPAAAGPRQGSPTTTAGKEVSPAAKKIPCSLNQSPFIYSMPFQQPSREDLKLTTKGR